MTSSPPEYIVSRPVKGDDFYDRQEIINAFLNSNDSSIAVIGVRRIGKTSILRQINYMIENDPEKANKYVVVNLDLQNLVGDVTEILDGFREMFLEEQTIKDWFKGISRPSPENINPERFLKQIAAKAKTKNKTLILLCDEIEQVTELGEAGKYIGRTLRIAAEKYTNVRVVAAASPLICTSKEPLLSDLIDLLERHPIGRFNNKEAEKLCQLKNRRKESPIPKEIYEKIIELSGGHPYFIQKLCLEYYLSKELAKAIKAVNKASMVSNQFVKDISNLDEVNQDILRIIVPSKNSTNRIARKIGLPPDNMDERLTFLSNLGLIIERYGRWEISTIFFRKWLIKRGEKKDRVKKWEGVTFGFVVFLTLIISSAAYLILTSFNYCPLLDCIIFSPRFVIEWFIVVLAGFLIALGYEFIILFPKHWKLLTIIFTSVLTGVALICAILALFLK